MKKFKDLLVANLNQLHVILKIYGKASSYAIHR